jgi:formate hydrogenlyase transcriptional activator
MEPINRFEKLLAGLSARFASASAEIINSELTAALERVTDYFDVGSTTLIVISSQDLVAPPGLYYWGRPGIPPSDEELGDFLPRPGVPPSDEVIRDLLSGSWYHQRLLRGETVILNDLPGDLPPGTEAERRYLKVRPITANLTVPIPAAENRVACAVGLDVFDGPLQWTEATVERVRAVGLIFAHAIYRKSVEETLKANLAEISELKERAEAEAQFLREEIRNLWSADEIVGQSTAWKEMLSLLAQVAPLDTPVLLLGETGTGKELLARAIHNQSPRKNGPFVAVNCAAIPESLQESELFGHEKGAFTGAISMKPGRFELADGGTLFLDEVGDMVLELQAKLLRVLQSNEFERVGGTKLIKVDVRVVAATNLDLAKAMNEGAFRKDFYYRLSAFTVRVPPLRERVEDIPLLIWYFINRRQPGMGRHVERISRRVMESMKAYPWPGNVRELENLVERTLILSPGATFEVDAAFPFSQGLGHQEGGVDLLSNVERAHIVKVLERCGWRINGPGNAAEAMGLNPNTLRFRMKKLAIERPARKT